MSSSKSPNPKLIERVARLEADVCWLKKLTSVELLLLVATLLGIIVQLVR